MNKVQIIQPAIKQGFDYSILDENLAAECQETAARIKGRLRTSVIDIGNDLIAIREKLGHGRFGPWLDVEFSMSARQAENLMATARLAAKYEINAYLPPTILIALASPSADQGIVQEVLDDANTGARQSVADVKARLAKAKDAQRKAHANQKKFPEQMKKEQAAKKRQENLDRAHEEKWAAIKAREVEAVGKAARLLVDRFGAGGTLELFTIMRGAAFHQVEKMFLLHPNAVMDHTFLTEQDIEAKFGGTL